MTITRSDAKKADVEQDLAQYKEETDARLGKLETALDALRTESENRHTELMNLILMLQNQTKPPPTTTSATVSLPPPTTITSATVSLPPLFTSAGPTTHVHGPPIFQSSSLIFDEQGHPLPWPPENRSSNKETFPHVGNRRIPQTMSPGNFSFSNFVESSQPFSIPQFVTEQPAFGSFGQPSFTHGHGRGSGPTGERVWTPGMDYRLRKLKMPLFDGEDAYGWVYRVERFFDIQGLVTSGERMKAATLCMEGPALAWYRWSDSREPFRCWEQLKNQLLDRFQPSQNGDLYEQFLNIKQEGTARDYVALFESMAAQLEGISEKVLEGTFMKGLKLELRTTVRLLQPTGLNQAIKLALMVDESSPGSREESERGNAKGPPVRTGGGGSRSLTAPAAGGARPKTEEAEQPFKRMTDTEYAEKRAKGLCFRCDGKFAPGHRCPEKTLQVLIVPGKDDEEEATWEEFEHPPP